jgi:single-stranded DNA-binding protein
LTAPFTEPSHRCEPKTSANGKPYLRLSVRVGDGDAVQWVTVLAFDDEAIAQADKFEQGSKVYIEGRISINEWTGRDGEKKTGLNVMSFHTRLPQIGRNRAKKERPAKHDADAQHRAAQVAEPFLDDDIPDL